jgi:heavy metal sensor kinase
LRLNTLRARVVTWYVGLLATALIVFGAALYFGVRQYLTQSIEQSLSSDAKAIGQTFLAHEEEKGAAWMAGEITEAYAPELSGRFIRITRQDGTILYQSGDTRSPVIDVSRIARLPFDSMAAGFRAVGTTGSNDLLIYTQPFRSSLGTRFTIETGASLAPMQRVLASLARIVLLITPILLLAAALGGPMLMTLPLRPLVTLTERAKEIGTSKLGERLPVVATGDEMERLTLALNRMIGRLEDALSHNRRFSADVSHELRTPLTIMRGELEMVLGESDLRIPIRSAVESALEEIGRMAAIVESLLAIARLDSGTDVMNLQLLDLSKLCGWVVEQMHLLAEEKRIALFAQTVPMLVSVDPARMKQVFVNLIDNAIKYTAAGGSIYLSSFIAGRTAIVEIRDTGVGIAPDALPQVFERFFRADKVRSRVSGGTGLGLSIVKAICEAHGGTISVTSAEGVGTTVRVEVPLTTEIALVVAPAVVAPLESAIFH